MPRPADRRVAHADTPEYLPPATENFARLLSHAATAFADRPAMVLRDGHVTFDELGRRAAAVMAALAEAGVVAGDVVTVLVRDPDDAAAAYHAALGIGAIGINVNELYRPRQLEHVLEHARARVLVTSRELLASLPRPIRSPVPVLLIDDVARDGGEFRPVARSGADHAQVIYTSGSMGQPKGVLLSHANLWAGTRIVAGYLDVRPSDRIASLLPFSFVYGFNQLNLALFAGATLVVERSPLAREIVATLRRERVTMLAAVPPLWLQLLGVGEFRERPIESLRVMTNAGGKLPTSATLALRAAQPHAALFLMYGLTEVFRSTYLPPQEVDRHPDSMGRAIPESVVYVVDEDGRLCPPGVVGELAHGGPTVALGYLHDPEATARVFRPNPFLAPGQTAPDRIVFSGDMVRRDEHGLLYYVGRRDRLVKSLGYRVSPEEITDVLYASGEVREAVVLTEPDRTRGTRLVACVVLTPDGSLDRVRRFCGIELPRYMQPTRFEALEELPRNASGKHDLVALHARLALPAGSADDPS